MSDRLRPLGEISPDRPAWVIDAKGNRRQLKAGDVLRSGERLTVGLAHMDGGTPGAMEFRDDIAKMREAVRSRLGDAAVADKSDEYIRACFDTLNATGRPGHAAGGTPNQAMLDGARDGSHAAYVESLRTGYLGDNAAPTPAFDAATAHKDAADAHTGMCDYLANAWRDGQ